MSRAVVAVEMIHLSKNGIMEFKDTPPIADVRTPSIEFLLIVCNVS